MVDADAQQPGGHNNRNKQITSTFFIILLYNVFLFWSRVPSILDTWCSFMSH